MIKFLLTPLLLISSIVIAYTDINNIPLFTLIYSIFIILGDLVLPRDYKIYDNKNKGILLISKYAIIILFINKTGVNKNLIILYLECAARGSRTHTPEGTGS